MGFQPVGWSDLAAVETEYHFMPVSPKIKRSVMENGWRENILKVYVVKTKSKWDMIPEGTEIFVGIAAFAGYGNWYLCRVDLADDETLTYPVFVPGLGAYCMISPHVFLWALC